MELGTIILLAARLPLYAYAGFRVYRLRSKTVVISRVWLLMLAATSPLIAISAALRLIELAALLGTATAISIFMLARTASAITTKE